MYIQPGIQNAQAIVSSYSLRLDAELFLKECALCFARHGLFRVASVLMEATGCADGAETAVFQVPSANKVESLIDPSVYPYLAQKLLDSETPFRSLLITWPELKGQPFRILPSMAPSVTVDEQVILPLRVEDPVKASFHVAEIMAAADKPMSVVDMETSVQIWTNPQLINLLEMSAERSRSLSMREMWQHPETHEDDGMAYMERLLRQQNLLEWEYTTNLKPGDRRRFHSVFQLIFEGSHRHTTLHEYEPLQSSVHV